MALKAQLVILALTVQSGPSVTDSQKISLGLSVPTERQPIPVPSAAPALDIVSVIGRTVRIRLHDAAGEGRRSKPAGVRGAAVMSFVGATAPTDPAAYKWEGSTNQSITEITVSTSVAEGARVWLTAMWFNEREQRGPACSPVGTNTQVGGMSLAA